METAVRTYSNYLSKDAENLASAAKSIHHLAVQIDAKKFYGDAENIESVTTNISHILTTRAWDPEAIKTVRKLVSDIHGAATMDEYQAREKLQDSINMIRSMVDNVESYIWK
jgi:hypothetical protein